MANYPCKKFFLMAQRLSIIHPLRTDRQTDGRQTDDNTIDAYSIAVSASKIV